MRYTPEEEEFILWLAEAHVAERHRIPVDDVCRELEMPRDYFDRMTRSFPGKTLFTTLESYPSGVLVLTPRVASVEVAREIQACRAAAEANATDRVAGVEARARRHKYLAPLIVAVRAAGPIVALIGGIVAVVVVLLRGC